MKRLLFLASRVVLFIVVVGAIFGGGMLFQGAMNKANTKNAQKVGQKFVSLIATGYPDKAYPMVNKDFQDKMPQAAFVAQMSSLKTASPTYLPAQIFLKGSTAYYYQKVDNLPKTSAGRTDGNFSVSLKKEGSGWKVLAVTVN